MPINVGLGGSKTNSSGTSRTQTSGQSSTTLSGTSIVQRFDEQSKAMLDAFTAAMNQEAGEDSQYTRENAIADAMGTVDQIFRQFRETALPQIFQAQTQTGAYNASSSQLLANDAYGEAVASSASVISENIARYAQLGQQERQTQLSALLDAFKLQGSAYESETIDQTSNSRYSGTSTTRERSSGSSLSAGIGGSFG